MQWHVCHTKDSSGPVRLPTEVFGSRASIGYDCGHDDNEPVQQDGRRRSGDNMITPSALKTLTTFTAVALTNAIRAAGYKRPAFQHSMFVGITTGGQFAYKVEYMEDNKLQINKVFLSYDPAAGRVSADY